MPYNISNSWFSRPKYGQELYKHKSNIDDYIYMFQVVKNLTFESLDIINFISPLGGLVDYNIINKINKEMEKKYINTNHEVKYIIGNPGSRFMCCTVSTLYTGETDKKGKDQVDLFVTFRPLNIINLTASIKDAFKYVLGTKLEPDVESGSIDSLLYLINKLNIDTVDNKGRHNGYVDILTNINVPSYNVSVDSEGETKIFKSMKNNNIIDSIVFSIEEINKIYNIQRVIFSGFSLGSASSLISASLVSEKIKLPSTACYQLCGTKSSTQTLSTSFLDNCQSLVIKDDPVAMIPKTKTDMIHQGVVTEIDFDIHNIITITQPNYKYMTEIHTVLGQISSKFAKWLSFVPGIGEDRFISRHLYGESVSPMLLIYLCFTQNYSCYYKNFVSCDKFISNCGACGKFKICPSNVCNLETKNNKNYCVSKYEPTNIKKCEGNQCEQDDTEMKDINDDIYSLSLADIKIQYKDKIKNIERYRNKENLISKIMETY